MSDAAAGFKLGKTGIIYLVAIAAAIVLAFTGEKTDEGITLFGSVPFAFVIFVLILMGVAFFHHYTLYVALAGVVAVTLYTAIACPGFAWSTEQVTQPAPACGTTSSTRASTRCSTSAASSSASRCSRSSSSTRASPTTSRASCPRASCWGGFALLAIVWVLSSFLDNIAAAMIGGVIARTAFKGRVSVGYVAAIVAASNAGGAWSVLGDTTTTMMWIDGVSPFDVAHCAVAQRRGPGRVRPHRDRTTRTGSSRSRSTRSAEKSPIDWTQLLIVLLILARRDHDELPAREAVRRRVGGDPPRRVPPQARLGRAARRREGRRVPPLPRLVRVADARQGAAPPRRGRRRSAWASSRPCSTTSR